MESWNKFYYVPQSVFNKMLILHPYINPDLAAILEKWRPKLVFLYIYRLGSILEQNMSS